MTEVRTARNIDVAKLEMVAGILKCIAHPVRLKVIELLEAQPGLTVSQMLEVTGVEQSLLSHHLTKMKDKGLLSSERDGKNIRYSLAVEQITSIFDCMEKCEFVR